VRKQVEKEEMNTTEVSECVDEKEETVMTAEKGQRETELGGDDSWEDVTTSGNDSACEELSPHSNTDLTVDAKLTELKPDMLLNTQVELQVVQNMEEKSEMVQNTGVEEKSEKVQNTGVEEKSEKVQNTGVEVKSKMVQSTGVEEKSEMVQNTGVEVMSEMVQNTGVEVKSEMVQNTGVEEKSEMVQNTGVEEKSEKVQNTGVEVKSEMVQNMEEKSEMIQNIVLKSELLQNTGVEMKSEMVQNTELKSELPQDVGAEIKSEMVQDTEMKSGKFQSNEKDPVMTQKSQFLQNTEPKMRKLQGDGSSLSSESDNSTEISTVNTNSKVPGTVMQEIAQETVMPERSMDCNKLEDVSETYSDKAHSDTLVATKEGAMNETVEVNVKESVPVMICREKGPEGDIKTGSWNKCEHSEEQQKVDIIQVIGSGSLSDGVAAAAIVPEEKHESHT
jgi:hypothetical protein